jgi:hypothetical protein
MTGLLHEKELSRSSFVKASGALVVGFSLAGAGRAGRASAAAPGSALPIPVDQLDARPQGAGEEPISALFPAIANAFFDATGVRLRQAPMTPAVVRDALARAA